MLNQFKQRFLSFLVIMIAFFSVQAWASDNPNPYVLMSQTADKLFSTIKENQSTIKQNPNYLRTIVRQELMPYIHVNYAGSLVLGTYFKSATPIQRTQFFQAFSQFIEQSYAQVLTMYQDQKIQIEKEKPLGNKTIVSIRVNIIQNDRQPPVKLDFKWRKNSKTGIWQVYDMVAEGISMVETKKNEWSSQLRQQGIEALTTQIQASANADITLNKK